MNTRKIRPKSLTHVASDGEDKYIPLDIVIGALDGAQNRLECSDLHMRYIETLLGDMAGETVDGPMVIAGEVEKVFESVRLAIQYENEDFLTKPRGMRIENPVDIEEFCESREYLGLRGNVRPRVMDELVRLFHSEDSDAYLEAVLGGCIGWGKTFFSMCGSAYLLYRVSCYHCPQIEFGLAPGTSIVWIMQSKTAMLAKKVVFDQFGGMLRSSPYFTENFPFDTTLTTELRFPNDIMVLPRSGSDTAALGMNVLGGILDELNFMDRVENSTNSRFTGEGEYDQASKLYNTAMRRMKSRFVHSGKVPGKLFLVSSANYPGDFIDRKRIEMEAEIAETGHSTTFYASMSQWEAFEGTGRLSDETFLVEVGDESRQSRMLESRDEAVDPDSIIEVPVDYLDDFKRDLEASIRDLAGLPVGGSNAWIKQRDKIALAGTRHEEVYEGEQLFLHDRININSYMDRTETLINEKYLSMLEDHTAYFCAHVDLALTGDSCGVSIGHFAGYQTVGRSQNWDENEGKYVECESGERARYVLDGILEIAPPMNDEIDINTVGDLLQSIASRLNLVFVTADSFQSASLMQRMRKTKNCMGKRIKSVHISVDAQLAPYAEVKQALRDERLMYPNSDKLKKELRELQFDPKAKKVDHPPDGSKDVADSVAGVVHMISVQKQSRKMVSSMPPPKKDESGNVIERPKAKKRRRGGSRRRIH